MSAYFTVFTWSYLHVHATKLENADQLYSRQLGSPESIFKVREGLTRSGVTGSGAFRVKDTFILSFVER